MRPGPNSEPRTVDSLTLIPITLLIVAAALAVIDYLAPGMLPETPPPTPPSAETVVLNALALFALAGMVYLAVTLGPRT